MTTENGTEGADRAPRRHSPQLWLGTLAALALTVCALWYAHQPAAAAAAKSQGPGAVAVHTALAARRDVPVYLEGLGTAQAFYTVTMTARVDGQLNSVNFTEGQLVKKGQLLAQIDPRPYRAALDQVTASKAKDAAQLASAKADLDRYIMLQPQNLSSKQQVDDQRAQVAELAAQVQVDQAAIDNAQTQLDYTSIISPITGRTGIRLIDPGNNVLNTSSNGIVVVAQMQPISVIFTLPEEALLQVNRAMASGPVSVTALSRDDKTQLDTGTLAVIDNQIDTTTGTVRLKATFPNPHNTLWPGEFVNVRVLVAQERGVVTLPSAAIQPGQDGPFAYVVKPDSTVEARMLQLGEVSGDLTVVTSGVAPGERVVTSNQYRLEPGAHVQSS